MGIFAIISNVSLSIYNMLDTNNKKSIAIFDSEPVRRVWLEKEEKWVFSVVDVIKVLTDSINPGAYWRKLKERLKSEGNESVTKCHGLKFTFKGATLKNVSFLPAFALTNKNYRAIKTINFDGAMMDKLTYAALKGMNADLSQVTII